MAADAVIYVRRPGVSGVETIPLAPNTTELRLPPGLHLSGGAVPDHAHHLTNPDEQIAVWLPARMCRWCRAGY